MNRNLKKTLLIVFAALFVVASFLPSISAINEAGEHTKTQQANTKADMIYWEENFDSYTVGQGLHGVGGWEGWEGDPTWDSYVTDVQSYSPSNSVDVVLNSDTVQVFGLGGEGIWTFSCYQYVPSAFTGMSYLILLNTYGTGIHNWSTQLRVDGDYGIIESEFEGESFNLEFDTWIELKVVIDFDIDTQYIYYDGDLLSEKSWTAGVSGGGKLELGALDLFANGASSVYYDDFVLTGPEPAGPDLECSGDLDWVDVVAGSTVTGSFDIENIGAPASGLNWEIDTIPDWGTWTFTPESGTGLTPEDGALTIDVEVVAPDETEAEFSGKIKIINTDDPDDYCEIDVSLATPVSYQYPLLSLMMERFPILGRIIEALLG